MQFTRPFLLTIILLSTSILWAAPQKCPSETTSVPATITGTLEYHPGVYAWYGIRPTQPLCGQKVLQLDLSDNAAFRETHRFVNCEVTATGSLFVPVAESGSTSLGITDAHIQPGKTCKPGQPLPDYSAIPIPPTLHQYKVTATYNPRTFDFSAQAHNGSSGQSLSPWQTYVSDLGNDSRDLQRMYCANGFEASAPKNALGQPDLQANVDPDDSQAIEVAIPTDATVQLSFLCTRSVPAEKQ